MHHLEKNEIEELRTVLEKECGDIEKSLREHGKNIDGNWQGTPQGFSENEPDDVDEADKMEELAINVPLVEELEKRYRDVRDALSKIQNETYGICEKTGGPIPLSRLRANPAARTHIEHAGG